MRLFSSLNFLFIESGNEKRKGFLRELKRLKKVDKAKQKTSFLFRRGETRSESLTKEDKKNQLGQPNLGKLADHWFD